MFVSIHQWFLRNFWANTSNLLLSHQKCDFWFWLHLHPHIFLIMQGQAVAWRNVPTEDAVQNAGDHVFFPNCSIVFCSFFSPKLRTFLHFCHVFLLPLPVLLQHFPTLATPITPKLQTEVNIIHCNNLIAVGARIHAWRSSVLAINSHVTFETLMDFLHCFVAFHLLFTLFFVNFALSRRNRIFQTSIFAIQVCTAWCAEEETRVFWFCTGLEVINWRLSASWWDGFWSTSWCWRSMIHVLMALSHDIPGQWWSICEWCESSKLTPFQQEWLVKFARSEWPTKGNKGLLMVEIHMRWSIVPHDQSCVPKNIKPANQKRWWPLAENALPPKKQEVWRWQKPKMTSLPSRNGSGRQWTRPSEKQETNHMLWQMHCAPLNNHHPFQNCCWHVWVVS